MKKLSVHELTRISLCTALIAVCAWISIPIGDIPITLQTFGVFAALCILGGRNGCLSILVYILLGAVGAPVFAGMKGGMGALLGATGGYIVGFLFAGLVYWLITALVKKETVPVTVIALILGNCLCYLFGSLWFQQIYLRNAKEIGLAAVFAKCVVPYILPDLVKLFAAVGVSKAVKKVLPKIVKA